MGTAERWRVTWMPHPHVPATFAVDDDDTLVYLGFWHDTEHRRADLHAFAQRHGAELCDDERGDTNAATQLREYLAAERTDFELPVRLLGTEFQRRAWRALCAIPFGRVCSYGEQAQRVECPGGARAVGHANGQNPIAVVVPCHRVVGARGALTGFGGGIETKRWLLELERRRAVPRWSPKAGPRRPEPGDDQLGLFA